MKYMGYFRKGYFNGIADEAELALQQHDMKSIYRAVKHASGKSTSTQSVFPNKATGESCTSEEKALLRWTEYYTTALNHSASQPCPDMDAIATSAADDPNISADALSLVEV